VAAKALKDKAPPLAREKFEAEIRLLTEHMFDHPNIVTLHGICTLVSQWKDQGHCFNPSSDCCHTKDQPTLIVLEYMDKGDLYTYLQECEATVDSVRELSFHRQTILTA
jgi:serine/threonine protein kinase